MRVVNVGVRSWEGEAVASNSRHSRYRLESLYNHFVKSLNNIFCFYIIDRSKKKKKKNVITVPVGRQFLYFLARRVEKNPPMSYKKKKISIKRSMQKDQEVKIQLIYLYKVDLKK